MSEKIKDRIKRISEPSVKIQREYNAQRIRTDRALSYAIKVSRQTLHDLQEANRLLGVR